MLVSADYHEESAVDVPMVRPARECRIFSPREHWTWAYPDDLRTRMRRQSKMGCASSNRRHRKCAKFLLQKNQLSVFLHSLPTTEHGEKKVLVFSLSIKRLEWRRLADGTVCVGDLTCSCSNEHRPWEIQAKVFIRAPNTKSSNTSPNTFSEVEIKTSAWILMVGVHSGGRRSSLRHSDRVISHRPHLNVSFEKGIPKGKIPGHPVTFIRIWGRSFDSDTRQPFSLYLTTETCKRHPRIGSRRVRGAFEFGASALEWYDSKGDSKEKSDSKVILNHMNRNHIRLDRLII